jgi:hypothetical protein
MAMRQAKAGLFVAGFFVLLLAAAMIGEGVIRNEISPWAWTQFSVHAKKHGAADALWECYFTWLFTRWVCNSLVGAFLRNVVPVRLPKQES